MRRPRARRLRRHAPGAAREEGQRLRFADDREGTSWWLTAEEAERALARTAELEAQLAGKR